MAQRKTSPIQKQIESLESKAAVLEKIISLAKTNDGQLTDSGKRLVATLKKTGLDNSAIAVILDVTPAALSP